MNSRVDAAFKSDIGLRRETNEDAATILRQPDGTRLLVVADGMGGPGGGDVASQLAVQVATQQAGTDMNATLGTVSEAVREQAQAVGVDNMGTTIAGMTLNPHGQVTVFNVGDTRIYRLRGGHIEQLSYDHVQPGEGDNLPLSQFIGQPRPLQPSITTSSAQDGDIYVICTDGLWRLVEPQEIAAMVRPLRAKRAVEALVARARARGAPDNVTVLVCRVGASPIDWKRWSLAASGVALALIVVAIVALLLVGGGGDEGGGDDAQAKGQVVVATLTTTPAGASFHADFDQRQALADDCTFVLESGPSDYACLLEAEAMPRLVTLAQATRPTLRLTVTFITAGSLGVRLTTTGGVATTLYLDTQGDIGALNGRVFRDQAVPLQQPLALMMMVEESGAITLKVDEAVFTFESALGAEAVTVSLEVGAGAAVQIDDVVLE